LTSVGTAIMNLDAPCPGEELAALLRIYSSRCSQRGRSDRGRDRRRPPKTHLHAELVRKRRDPGRSPKRNVQEALATLLASAESGDAAAVEQLLARTSDEPVCEEWQVRYKAGAQAYWNHFYSEKTVNFFKDRHYLREEFPELMPDEVRADPRSWVDNLEIAANQGPPDASELPAVMDGHLVVLEIGCAVGNGLMPLLRANPNIFGLACDLSPVAVQFLKDKAEYRCGRCFAFPCDVTRDSGGQPTPEHHSLEEIVPKDSVDFATLLFVLSAIDPAFHRSVAAQIRGRLRPGGVALVRDYGRGDLAQVRFAPGHWLGGDLYVRGDGTLAHFQTTEGLTAIFNAEGFETLECSYRRTEVVNRGTGVRMPRVWVQAKFRRQE